MTIEKVEGMNSKSQQTTTMKKEQRVYSSGCTYDGEWKAGGSDVSRCRQGNGRLEHPDKKSVYRGQFEQGLCQGVGSMDIAAGATNNTSSSLVHHYDGQFVEGQFHGYGVFTFNDGSKFEGEFAGGKMNGLGRLTLSPADAKRASRSSVDGRFEEGRLVQPQSCQSAVDQANKAAAEARSIAPKI